MCASGAKVGFTEQPHKFDTFGGLTGGSIGVTATVVISNMGLDMLQRYVDRIVGGIAQGTLYQMVSGGVVQYRLDWTYTDLEGKSFGPYCTYWSSNPYCSLDDEIA